MSRKSLFFGSIVLILAMLFALAGCKDPVAGPQGPRGDQGNQGKQGDSIQGPAGDIGAGGLSGVSVSAVDLEDAFNDSGSGIVTLFSDVASVYGKVPAGKTLRVLGEYVAVPALRTLELEDGATLIIYKGAVLSASAIPGAAVVGGQGSLTAGTGAKVEGEGAIILPVDLSSDGSYTDTLHWESSEITIPIERRYPGSYYGVPLGSLPTVLPVVRPLSSEAIARVFTEKNRSELTVQNVPDLGQNAIPVGKKLTLVGTGNTITAANFTLLNNTRLTLAAGGVLSIGNPGNNPTIFQSNSDALFTNEGTVYLRDQVAGTSSRIDTNGGTVTNNGKIISFTQTNDSTVIPPLLAITGTGVIELESTADVDLSALDAIPLNQHLVLKVPEGVLSRRYTLSNDAVLRRPFIGIAEFRTVTIESGVVLALGDEIDDIGTTVYNSGTITTATISTRALRTIFGETGNRGRVEATEGVVDDTFSGVFTIPQGITLVLSNDTATLTSTGGPFPSVDGFTPKLIVEGTLIVTEDDTKLAPSGDINISGSVYLEGTDSNLTIAAGRTLNISSSAVFDAGAAASEGTLEAAAGSTIIINGETGYSFDPAGVVGRDYATALAAINETRTILTDKIPLAGANPQQWIATGVEKVVGTVDLATAVVANPPVPPKAIAAGAPHPVYATNSASGISPIEVPENTNITITALASLGGVFSTSTAFTLSNETADIASPGTTGYPWVLKLADNAYAGSTEKFDVLRFNSYQIENSGLTTPIVDHLFHIGVRSSR
jgi:hypothetical protein